MDQKSDLKLVLRVQKGDHHALALLIDRYQLPLLAYARRLGADPHSAQDIVQQSFINAYQNINSFNPQYKFSSWIYRIVHNQAINHFKKQPQTISLDFFDYLAEIIPGKTNLEAEVLQQDQKKQLQKQLKKLPLKYRSVLTLYYFQDKKYQEISDILHIPISTVGIRLSRAKAKLKILTQHL